jgi:DNA-binding MarR family transcriptional regulator
MAIEEPDAADLLLRVSRRLLRRVGDRLAPLGVTQAQVRALRALDSEHRPVRMGLLAERLDVVPRSATSLIDALAAAGLVRREADPDDRRAVAVSLTPEGRRTLVAVRRVRRQVADELLAPLDRDQRAALRSLLEAVAASGPARGRTVTRVRTAPWP